MAAISQMTFSNVFLLNFRKVLYFDTNFTQVCLDSGLSLPEPVLIKICHHMVSLGHNELTHLALVLHICQWIGPDNGLSPILHQAIIWTIAGLLSVGPCNKTGAITVLTHWGRVTHICVGTNTNIGSENGLSPGQRQAIIWTNAGILLIGPLGTNFSGILSEIPTFSFKKMHFKTSSVK